jgi:hypothetical protein
MTGDGKAAAALQAQAQNFAEQTRVYEDWNKKLRDVVVQERERRAAAEADVERLAAALQAAAQEAMAPSIGDASADASELESRCKQLQLELSREQDARRRAETDARRTAEQNQQLREKLQVLGDTVAELEADSVWLKQTAASIARDAASSSPV